MIKRQKTQPRIFLGWWINLATGVLSGLGWGVYGLGFSALFKPIATELGLSRAVASAAAGIGKLGGGFEAALTGWLSDRFGSRWVVFAGMCIMASGLVLMGFINSTWSYYIVWGVIVGIGHNLGFVIAVDKVLINWFISKRGLAFGVRFALLGIVGLIVLPVISWMITVQGWRITCIVWGLIILAVTPIALYFVKQQRPEYYGLLPDGAAVGADSATDIESMIDKGVGYAAGFQETEFTLRQAMKTSAYWVLTVAWAIQELVYGGISVHLIPFLTDMGIDPILAAGMMTLMVFFTIPSRFLGGFLVDRFGKGRLRFILSVAFLFQAVGITAFLLHQSMATVYVLLILYGFGNGALAPLDIAIRGRYFGRKAYGSIQGSSFMLVTPIGLLAPVYTGWVYDVTGNYTTAFVLFAAVLAFATFLVCLLQPPRATADITDTRQFM